MWEMLFILGKITMKGTNKYGLEVTNLDPISHILQRPDHQTGSTIRLDRLAPLFDGSALRSVSIDMPLAVQLLMAEIICNAHDNVRQSRQLNLAPHKVTVHVNNKGTTTVTNHGGMSIPFERFADGTYHPDILFGTLHSSTNYNDKEQRETSGQNGRGAKHVNVFSTEFKINIICDEMRYRQTWRNNMRTREEPIITNVSGKPNMVSIRFTLDLERFDNWHNWQDYEQVVSAYALFLAYTGNILVEFVGPTIQWTRDKVSATEMAHLLYPGDNIMQFKSPQMKGVIVDHDPEDDLVWTWVNGAFAYNGGVHVDKVLTSLRSNYIENWITTFGLTSRQINISFMRTHLTVIGKATLINPKFADQTKSKLTNPEPDNFTFKKTSIVKWKLISRLKQKQRDNSKKILKKTDGKKVHRIAGMVGDASEAGGKRSSETTLIIIEGDSASKYATRMVDIIGGRKFYGIYALSGVPINPFRHDAEKLAQNRVFCELKKIIGLREDLDYTIPKNRNTLRYGKILIYADADEDGTHIAGLILTIFSKYPSLIEAGILHRAFTPQIRARRNDKVIPFMTRAEFNRWAENNDISKWEITYYKGLASSTNKDVTNDSRDRKETQFEWDKNAVDWIEQVFALETEPRKLWLSNLTDIERLKIPQVMTISDFMQRDMATFSLFNISRNIPSALDGLKPTQRKIVHTCLEDLGAHKTRAIVFAGQVMAKVGYHHGESSLHETIVSLSHDYVGTNNIPLIKGQGLFGSRHDLQNPRKKKKKGFRYLFVSRPSYHAKLFPPIDRELYQYVHDSGEICEPETLYPVVPLCLINGISGIGTGWSTALPNHSVKSVVESILSILDGEPISPQVGYRRFRGKITQNNNSVTMTGRLMRDGDDFVIGEIPPRWCCADYVLQVLEPLVAAGKLLTFVDETKKNDVPRFRLIGLDKSCSNRESLALIERCTWKNFHLMLPGELIPHKFESPLIYLRDYWVPWRVSIYDKRKQHILTKIEVKLANLTERCKFIRAVISGELKVVGRPRAEVRRDLIVMEIDPTIGTRINVSQLTVEGLTKAQEEIDQCQEEYDNLSEKSPENLFREDLAALLSVM
jgi:DNA topoisomerase II